MEKRKFNVIWVCLFVLLLYAPLSSVVAAQDATLSMKSAQSAPGTYPPTLSAPRGLHLKKPNLTAPSNQAASQDRKQALNAIQKMEPPFIENRGQLDKQVAYYIKPRGCDIFLTRTGEMVFAFTRAMPMNAAVNSGTAPLSKQQTHSLNKTRRTVIKIVPENPSADMNAVQVSGRSQTPAKINYFKGKQSDWIAGIPTYKEVVYDGLFQDTRVIFQAGAGMIEDVYELAPGADPSRIRFRVEGAEALRQDANGELKIITASGEFTVKAPQAFQEIDGRKIEIKCRFEIDGMRFGYILENYNPLVALVIDPQFVYGTFLGGPNGDDYGYKVAVHENKAYIVGHTCDSEFPFSVNPYDKSLNSDQDIFFSVLDPSQSGSSGLLYSTIIGGAGKDYAHDVAVADGKAYIVGRSESMDFPVTPGAYDQIAKYGKSFLCVLNPANNGESDLLYSTLLGGSQENDYAQSVAVANGKAYIAGYTLSDDFPVTSGAYNETKSDGTDAFFSVIHPLGQDSDDLIYSTFIAGDNSDMARDIAVSGNIAYIVGSTESNDFPRTANAYDTEKGGYEDAFLTVLNPAGQGDNDLIYSTYLGGDESSDSAWALAVAEDKVYMVGKTYSSDYPTTPNAYIENEDDNVGGFLSVLTPTGNGTADLIYSTYLRNNFSLTPYDVAVTNGLAYIVGYTYSTNFPVTAGAYDPYHNGGEDAFLNVIDPSGNGLADLRYSTFLGGSDDDKARGIALSEDYIYIVGETASADFPTTVDAYDTTPNAEDAFLIVFNRDAQDVGALQFDAAAYTLLEGDAHIEIPITRANGANGAVSIDYVTEDGTAIAESDYTAVSGTLNWGDGDASPKTIFIPILDDTLFDDNETFQVTLSHPVGADMGLHKTTVTIIDDEPGKLRLSHDNYRVHEKAGGISVRVFRENGDYGQVGVHYETNSGSALTCSDLAPTSGILTWAEGDMAPKTITVPVLNDGVPEGSELFKILLSDPTGGAQIVNPSGAIVEIVDNPQGVVQLSTPTYSAAEEDGYFEIQVMRFGQTGAITVDYATSDQSATAGTDYTAVSGVLSWADGDTAVKTVQIPISADILWEDDETIGFTLSNPTGGALLSSPSAAVLTIRDSSSRDDYYLSGRVTDINGNPIVNVCVEFYRYKCDQDDPAASALTDVNGVYAVILEPRSYFIIRTRVCCLTTRDYIDEWWGGDAYMAETDCSNATYVYFGGNTTIDNIDFILDDDRDTDNDGLSDNFENNHGTSSSDGDTDDDGLSDGVEDANHSGDVDAGETDPRQADSDLDGIQDGTETGRTLNDIDQVATDTDIFIPDLDPSTVTDPLDMDTDDDGWADGEEDLNFNGRIDAGESDPNVAADRTVYDVFGLPRMKTDKWHDEMVREIVDGKLVYKIRGATNTDGRLVSQMAFADPGAIHAMKAGIDVTESMRHNPQTDKVAAGLEGYFYEDAHGSVLAGVYVGDRGNGLEAWWEVTDGDGQTRSGDIKSYFHPNSTFYVEIGYNEISQNLFYTYSYSYCDVNTGICWVFISTSTGDNAFIIPGPTWQGPPLKQYKALTIGVWGDGAKGNGSIATIFDNVRINSESSYYDTFDEPLLDASKWKDDSLEMVREVRNGRLQSDCRAVDSSVANHLYMLPEKATDYFEVKAEVQSDSQIGPGALGFARMGGYFYNNSRGPSSGVAYNGYEADVWAEIRLELDENGALKGVGAVRKSSDADQTSFTSLFERDFIAPVNADTQYQLIIERQGSSLIFHCNDEQFTYPINTAIYPPSQKERILTSGVRADAVGESGYVKTTFDDVYNYVGGHRGDLNGDGRVDLADVIIGLQVVSGQNPPFLRANYINSGVDVDGDNKIGLAEPQYILQKLSGLR